MQIFYTVHVGDTLNNIALRWNIPLRSLIEANNISAPYVIYPGQQLSMPPGVNTYVVKAGDTVYSISQRYRIPMSVIMDANGMEPPYTIVPGMEIHVPAGVPYYMVMQGDTLFRIAQRYNVSVNGKPRPDLIMDANEGLTTDIVPGMFVIIPYPPPGVGGTIATILSNGLGFYIGLYNSKNGHFRTIQVSEEADRGSALFWSPDMKKIAYIGKAGIISIIDIVTGDTAKIDQIDYPAFVDWSHDGRRIVYSTGSHIRIYDVVSHAFSSINIMGASYVQWFPYDTEFLYEAEDLSGLSQLYRAKSDGSNIRKITNNQDGPLNHVRLSTDGRFVLYTSPGASISIIYTFELATGDIYQIPGGPEAKNYYPSWSPDSSKIAYSSTHYQNGKYYSMIRVSGIKGDGDTTLAIASCYSTQVSWSPDSSKIAYLSGCREDAAPVEAWSISLKKPVPYNIISGFQFFDVEWSPSEY